MRINRSLSARMSIIIIVAVSVIFSAAFVGVALSARRAIKEYSIKNTALLVDKLHEEINLSLREVEAAAENMIWVVKEKQTDPKAVAEVPRYLVQYNPPIIGSTVAFEPWYYESEGYWYAPYSYNDEQTGEIKSIQMGNENYDYFNMEWYREPRRKAVNRWSDPYFDEGGGEQMMATYSIPIWNENMEVYAILTADISLKRFSEKVAAVRPYAEAMAFLLGRNGSFICHPDSTRLLTKTIFSEAADFGSAELAQVGGKMLAGEEGHAEYMGPDGRRHYIAYSPVSNGWSVALSFPYENVFLRLRRVQWLLMLFGLLDLLLLYIVIRKVVTFLTQPIILFTYTAMSIGKGNFKVQVPEVHTHDELKRLHDSLEYMLRSFKDYISELRSSTASNERYASELDIASNIQRQMLPSDFSNSEGVDIFALLSPARQVGGDMYDFAIRNRTVYFAVGDVSGKGVPAALYMAITRAAFRFSAGLGLGPEGILSRINDVFSEGNESAMFVTLFMGKLHLDTLELEWCNGGHNPIVLVRPDGKAEFLAAKPNLAAGLMPGFPYEKESCILEKGTRILVYTDGVSEAERADLSQYGEQRLLDFAASVPREASSQEFCEALFADVHAFAAGNPQNDDVTILSLTV
ncbi:MAG: SpoIIE family protein phosphatase [Bacteroidales bacterium]|nr:SpoIIE family protein phosphatase [Bacteroidales bacterium]